MERHWTDFPVYPAPQILSNKKHKEFEAFCFVLKKNCSWFFFLLFQFQGTSTKPVRVQAASGWCSQSQEFVLRRSARSRDLDTVIFVWVPFYSVLWFWLNCAHQGLRLWFTLCFVLKTERELCSGSRADPQFSRLQFWLTQTEGQYKSSHWNCPSFL